MATLSTTARLSLDKTGFDSGIKGASGAIAGFANSMKAQLAGAFSVAAVSQYVRGLVNTVGRIKDLSEQYGITTTEVQKTDFALKQSGLQFEDLSSALVALGRHRREAVEGNIELRKTFERYGLTLNQLNDPQTRTFDVLLKISDAMRGSNVTAKEQMQLMDLLGPRAGKLVNILGELSSVKIDVIDAGAIEKIDTASKQIEKLKQKLDQLAANPLSRILQGGEWMIGGPEKIAADFAKLIGGAFKPIVDIGIGGLAGAGEKKDPGKLWEEGAAKVAKDRVASGGISSDAFQRIGAFTGVSAQSAQIDVARQQLSVLERLRDELTRRGIIIRGTD